MNQPIYLDYNATTPVDPAVAKAMLPYLTAEFGNPSSAHAFGRSAHEAIARARSQVARLIGARTNEIVFTGGGTEASNLAIKGVVFPRLFGGSTDPSAGVRNGRRSALIARLRSLLVRPSNRVHVATSAVEHPATLRPCAFLERLGCRVTVLPVDNYGVVDLPALERALQDPTALVSIMHANNEVGTLQPIREIARMAHAHGALMHTDAAQSLGKIPVSVTDLEVDLLTIAGHKLYAPKGIGALYIRDGIALEPLIHGAGHESGRRAGTENVPYIVGLGTACELAHASLPTASERLRALRDWLWQRLADALGNRVVLNGHPEQRLPNTLNVNFAGHLGATLLEAVPEIAASTGSACHEGQVQLSPVLAAMGVPEALGRGAVRLSVGRPTTEAEIERAAERLIAATTRRPAVAVLQ
jgi:cysteine desulfurase